MKDTCDICKHCTHIATDRLGVNFYFCEIDGDYINEETALDDSIGCDIFVSNLDDDDRQEH